MRGIVVGSSASALTLSDRLKSALGPSVLLVTSLALVCLAAEVFLRLQLPRFGDLQTVFVPASGGDSRTYQLKPNAQLRFAGMRASLQTPILWQINAQGIRSDQPLRTVSDKFRILTFGDSEAFGWAVPLSATFQRHMERIDDRIEVINFGVPGYNIENTVDHMAEVLSRHEADLIFYMFHRNDLDPPLRFSPTLSNSSLYMFLKWSYFHIVYGKRKKYRSSPEGLQFFSKQFARMVDIANRKNVPLLAGFLHWNNVETLPPRHRIDQHQEVRKRDGMAWYAAGLSGGSINLEPGWRSYPRLDHHMSRAGHRETAEKLCEVISGGADLGCVPPYWHAMRDVGSPQRRPDVEARTPRGWRIGDPTRPTATPIRDLSYATMSPGP